MSTGVIRVILVGGDSTVDKLIQTVEGGKETHVAGIMLGSIAEATGLKEKHDLYPGFWLHDPTKYDNNPDATFYNVEVPDIEAANEEVRRLIGTPYGYSDCLKYALHKCTGVDMPDNTLSVDCSEAYTRIFRAGGLNIFPDLSPDEVSPDEFDKWLSNRQ